jgi:hypothetical protein
MPQSAWAYQSQRSGHQGRLKALLKNRWNSLLKKRKQRKIEDLEKQLAMGK